jgi:hypothetical protein
VIRVFVGYDDNEKVAFSTLSHSLLKHATQPIAITPIRLQNIKDVFVRERLPIQSTEFAFSRFLVPYLCNYSGHAIFMDCDMLSRSDISELWRQRTTKYAVQCVQHDYTPSSTVKFLNQPQTPYPKKNWSSMMLFNNAKCTTLTPDYVNSATGLELHQYKWLENEELIGKIDEEWNWLVGEYEYNPNAKLVHYTEGGPYFKKYKNCDYAKEWFDTFKETTRTDM